MFDGAGGISDEGEFEGLAGFCAGGEDGTGAWEGADVEAVLAAVVAFVGGFADDDAVFAVFGGDDGGVGVVAEEGSVVAGVELEAFGVEDGDVGIEEGAAEAHGFDFDREALAFFEGDDVVVFVLISGDALDGGVEFDALVLVEGVVRLHFVDGGELADPEGADFGDAVCAAEADGVFAEAGVGGDGEFGDEVVGGFDFDVGEGDAGVEEECFLDFV